MSMVPKALALDETLQRVANALEEISETAGDQKADKVQNAVSGNFAGLDATGNLTDSGCKPSDFLTAEDIAGKLDAPEGTGTVGQSPRIASGGGMEWASVGQPTDAQVETAVSDWLDNHPEATTTVEDGSITRAKLDSSLQTTVDEVDDLKSAINESSIAFDITKQFTFTDGKYVSASNGQLANGSVPSYSNYIPIPDGFDTVRMMMIIQNDTNSRGMGFYTTEDESTFISGKSGDKDTSLTLWEAEEVDIPIPSTAKFFRTTWFATTYEPYDDYTFKCELVKTGTVAEVLSAIGSEIDTKTDNKQTADHFLKIENKVKDHLSALNLFDKTTVTSEKYLNSSGQLVSASGTCVSAQILVTPGTKIILSHHLNSSTRYNIFQDDGGHFITGQAYPCNDANMVLTVPSGAKYLRCTVGESVLDEFYAIEQFSISDIKAPLTDLLNQTLVTNITSQFTFTDGKYVSASTGALANGSVPSYSGFVPVPDGCDKVRMMMIIQNDTNSRGMAFYTAQDESTFITGKSGKKDTSLSLWKAEEVEIPIPATAKYMRTTWFATTYEPYDDYQFKCELIKIVTVAEKTNAIETELANKVSQSELENTVSELENDIDAKADQSDLDNIANGYPNVFDKTAVTDDTRIVVATKETETNSSWSLSDYIEVNPGEIVRLSRDYGSAKWGTGLYDSGKTMTYAYPSNEIYKAFTVPEGIKYIRASVMDSDLNTYSINILSPFQNLISNMPDSIEKTTNPYIRHSIKAYGEEVDSYTHCAFPSVALFGDKEIVAYRASMSHLTPTDPDNWGGVMIDYRTPEGEWVHKGLLDTTGYTFNGELRDPKLTVSRDGKTLFCSCFTTYRKPAAPTTDVHDNVIFTLDDDLEITSMYLEEESSGVIWGNVITTPNGFLLISEYTNGSVYVKRGTAAFTGSLTGYTFDSTAVKTYSQTSLSECCLGYWNDKYLLIIMRRGNYVCKVGYTEDLEGTSGWVSMFIPDEGNSMILHAPMLLPNWYGKYLPVIGSRYVDSDYRYAQFALIKETTNSIAWVDTVDVDETVLGYSGYCGFAYLGGADFAIAYYRESTDSGSTIGAHTAMFFKHINIRRLMPSVAYLEF